jgi:hypothetical protein
MTAGISHDLRSKSTGLWQPIMGIAMSVVWLASTISRVRDLHAAGQHVSLPRAGAVIFWAIALIFCIGDVWLKWHRRKSNAEKL